MYLTAVSGSIVLLRLLIAGQATSIHQNFTSLSTLVHGHDIGLRSLQSESHDHGSCSRMLHSKRELSEPSTRCSNRYEWKGECKWWPGGPSTRYVEVTKSTREGIGSNLWKIASIYQRAIDFNLTPVLVGPFVVGHHTGDIGDWMGFTGNPAVKPIDPVGLQRAQRHRVPMPDENVDSWLLSQMSLTDVVYVPDMYRLEGWPRTWGGSWALIMNHCSYAWEALRSIFWGVPHKRDRCKSIVLRNKTRIDESHVPLFTTGLVSDSRPWVIGVHIRRGDIMMKETKHEVLPHTFFVTAVRSVLVGITASDPESRIIIFIFSEGPQELEEKNMILDENATPVEWNIPRDECQTLNLRCTQIISLTSSVFDALDCLAVADVMIGSKSGMSETAAALSTNVKIMPSRRGQPQDRVEFMMTEMISTGVVEPSVQAEVNKAIDDWKHCSAEARDSINSDPVAVAAQTYYQTVDVS